jgi:hypothetical protein
VMAYRAMNKPSDLGSGKQNEVASRSAFQDRALPLFYFVIIIASMAGWFWFLGYLSWRIVSWVTLQ